MSEVLTGERPARSGRDSASKTFPRLLMERAAERPDAVALQEKLYGIWQPVTWREYADRVRDFGHGLASLGVTRGEIVAVLGDNRPEWLVAEVAAQSIGAAVVGIYPTSLDEEIVHILTMSQAKVVVAEDQEQVDKLIRVKPMAPLLESVVFYDPHGLETYTEPWLMGFSSIEARGREWGETRPGWFEEEVAKGDPAPVRHRRRLPVGSLRDAGASAGRFVVDRTDGKDVLQLEVVPSSGSDVRALVDAATRQTRDTLRLRPDVRIADHLENDVVLVDARG